MDPRESAFEIGPARFHGRHVGASATRSAQAAPFLRKNDDRSRGCFPLSTAGARQFCMKTPFGKSASGLRLERMQGSPRYRDGEFHNLHPILPGLKGVAAMPSLGDFL